jgi:hypothetical protein
MRRLILIILLFTGVVVHGQDLTFKQVDTTTYNQYLRGDWRELTESGREALDAGIDYYYLQMRIAYAWLSMGRYRQAIKYYRNALNHNSSDHLANEYLYYSYKYAGRYNDALFQQTALTAAQKTAMEISDSAVVTTFGINYSGLSSDASGMLEYIGGEIDPVIDGTRKATHNLHNARMILSHRIGRAIIVNHKGSWLRKNELSYVVSNGVGYLSPEQPVDQLEYNLSMEITPVKGLTITPGAHYLNTTIPLYAVSSYGHGAGLERIPVSYLELTNWVASILVESRTRFFDLGLSFVNHNFNNIHTIQTGLHAMVYPMANLNLYFGFDGYGQLHMFNSESSPGLIIQPVAGVKLHDNLWIEITGKTPEHYHFYDVRNYVGYNNLEKLSSSLGISAIIPLYGPNMQLFLGYTRQSQSSWFFPENDMLNPLNRQNFHSHLITGGFKWKK